MSRRRFDIPNEVRPILCGKRTVMSSTPIAWIETVEFEDWSVFWHIATGVVLDRRTGIAYTPPLDCADPVGEVRRTVMAMEREGRR